MESYNITYMDYLAKNVIINMSKYEVPHGTLATYVIFTCVCISMQTQVTQT